MSPVAVDRTYQAQGAVSASTGAATVLIEVSDVASPGTNDWLLLATITLTLGTTSTSDGTYSNTNWRWVRARLSAISGTNASVTVWMGC